MDNVTLGFIEFFTVAIIAGAVFVKCALIIQNKIKQEYQFFVRFISLTYLLDNIILMLIADSNNIIMAPLHALEVMLTSFLITVFIAAAELLMIITFIEYLGYNPKGQNDINYDWILFTIVLLNIFLSVKIDLIN